MPLQHLGAHESDGAVTFGIWLPWVSAGDGNRLSVKIIHEDDQFLQDIPPREFPMQHQDRPPYGDYWSATVRIGPDPATPDAAWGRPGTYVYRYCLVHPVLGTLDWIIDPFAREFGVGKLSAFTLGYQPHQWSTAEASWRTPRQSDLVIYELNLAEFGGDLTRAIDLLAYLEDLGITCVEVMPVANVANSVDWGYLPLGYFGIDERFGNRADFQRFVDHAHQRGIAVIVDAVYGHTDSGFAYHDLYTRLRHQQNPMMGSFAKDLFGRSTDFARVFTRDFFLTANLHWLEVYHLDGMRYDCVPNYWDGATGVGYADLVYQTHQLVEARSQQAGSPWNRFADPVSLRLIQCAEQLEGPQEILAQTYSNCTWQNGTYGAARAVAGGDRRRLTELGHQLGLLGYPTTVTINGQVLNKSALQYIENHDHERFVCHFGLVNGDEAGNPLFLEGDRSQWYRVQPYLIALLLAKGIPMLWQGQEFAENYFLPENGLGRVMLLRPMRWDYFYDAIGTRMVRLVRDLLRLRHALPQFRTGQYFFFDHWERYQSKGVLLFARYSGAHYSLVAINTSGVDQMVPFWFPISGYYREELHGGAHDLVGVAAMRETTLTIPGNYGRVWTAN
jgi:1,4-alpha-glucan branching enzyme